LENSSSSVYFSDFGFVEYYRTEEYSTESFQTKVAGELGQPGLVKDHKWMEKYHNIKDD
jgi:hypothetical protein